MGFISNPSPIMGNDPNDLPRQIEVDTNGNVKNSITDSAIAVPVDVQFSSLEDSNPVPTKLVGSLTKLSTDPFPTEGVQNGWDLLEFYPDGSTKVYVYHDGWREI